MPTVSLLTCWSVPIYDKELPILAFLSIANAVNIEGSMTLLSNLHRCAHDSNIVETPFLSLPLSVICLAVTLFPASLLAYMYTFNFTAYTFPLLMHRQGEGVWIGVCMNFDSKGIRRYTYKCSQTYICMYIYIYVYIYHMHVYTYTYIYVCSCTYACIHIHMHIHVYIYMYIYAYI